MRRQQQGAGSGVAAWRITRWTVRLMRLAIFCAGLSVSAANAQTAAPQPTNALFTGFQVTGNDASAYLGGSTSFGKGLWSSGWRARAIGALGAYDYRGTLVTAGIPHSQRFDGKNGFLAALAGYQWRRGRATFKLFAGLEAEDQSITPNDPGNPVRGQRLGVLVQTESWLNFGARSFLSVDASYGSAFEEYWSLARLGTHIRPRLAIGVEGGALGNAAYNAGCGGGFIRITSHGAQITISSGVTGDYLSHQEGGYIAVDLYRAF